MVVLLKQIQIEQTLVSTANNIATRIRDLKVDNKTVTRRGKVGSTLVERDLLLK